MRPKHCGAMRARLKFFRDAALMYGAEGPLAATPGAVGLDLRADPEQGEVRLEPGERAVLPSGLAVEPLEEGVAAFIYARSGLGGVTGLTVAQGVGLVDPDYRGEIKIPLLNTGKTPQVVKRGDRIAQLVFQPFYRVEFTPAEELGESSRGERGFGHTGKE
jgi:dUTP pyrophosphatase